MTKSAATLQGARTVPAVRIALISDAASNSSRSNDGSTGPRGSVDSGRALMPSRRDASSARCATAQLIVRFAHQIVAYVCELAARVLKSAVDLHELKLQRFLFGRRSARYNRK